ncbi:hypothetical protein AJ88_46655 [Mesorhizobium amorphae CCBAU 01583]|nr:hypothetical protein AJ88_46655 [Mesorhizobium amorphae CCBAU 01583]
MSGLPRRQRRTGLAIFGRSVLRAAFRPVVELVDVVADIAAVLAEFRAAALEPHLFQRALGEPDIEGGLGCVEKRAALLGAGRAFVFVVHHGPRFA